MVCIGHIAPTGGDCVVDFEALSLLCNRIHSLSIAVSTRHILTAILAEKPSSNIEKD
jgi:hypothetical protein